MPRGVANRSTEVRCLAVWLATTGLAGPALVLLGQPCVALLRAGTWRAGFAPVLVGGCALVAVACLARLWWVTTTTALAVLRGVDAGQLWSRGGWCRRWVLSRCGPVVAAALLAQAGTVAATATAHGPAVRPPGQSRPHGVDLLRGLALPDRAVTTRRPEPAVVVRPGDTLWSLAERSLPHAATDREIWSRGQQLHAANRDVIGADPDLILPGQRLRMPPAGPAHQPTEKTSHDKEQP